ncbi:MAG: hypothetical protein AAF903_05905 [Pseudomonadota bacterium]
MDLIARIAALRKEQPHSLAVKHFEADWFSALPPDDQNAFALRVRSGLENPDSQMGCYALEADDYTRFAAFFDRVIADHHGVEIHDLDHAPRKQVLAEGPDLPLSKRIRIGRNLAGLPLPGGMDSKQRRALEQDVAEAVQRLPQEFQHFSLTPGHANGISTSEYQRLIEQHLFFKPMDTDPYLASAGIAGDWPVGRAAFVSADGGTIIWVNEEDHLRLMVMDETHSFPALLHRLQGLENALSQALGEPFATHDRLGFVTSCPTNIGTAMRASIHVPLPNILTQEGMEGLKGRATEMGLSVRGVGGEHTEAGADGMVDLSPRARLGVTPEAIIDQLQRGLTALMAKEASG